VSRITCDLRSNFKLLQSSASTHTDFELRIHGTSVVENPSLATVRVENTGTLPVAPEDIYEPIRLTVDAGTILNAVVTDKSDPAPDSTIAMFDGRGIQLTKGLWNQGDWVDVQIIVGNSYGDSLTISGSGRIKGGSVETRGSEEPEASNRMRGNWLIMGVNFAVNAAFVAIYAGLYRSAQRLSNDAVADLLAQVILLLYISTLLGLLLLSASGAYSYWLIRGQRREPRRARRRP